MSENFEKLVYADVFFRLPYPVREADKKEYQRVKIPCRNVHVAILVFELITGLDLSAITGIELYDLAKVKGNTRYDFRHFRTYQDRELVMFIAAYKRNVRRKLLNSII